MSPWEQDFLWPWHNTVTPLPACGHFIVSTLGLMNCSLQSWLADAWEPKKTRSQRPTRQWVQSVYPPGEGCCSGLQGWLIVPEGTWQNFDSGHTKLWGQLFPSLESVPRSHRTSSEVSKQQCLPYQPLACSHHLCVAPAPLHTPLQASWPGARS